MALKIICHMITTLDSRIVTSRWDLGPEADIGPLYENTAQKFDAQGWIVGRTTMAEYADNIDEHAPALSESKIRQSWRGAYRDGMMLAIVFDLKGKLTYEGCTLPTGEHLVAVLSSAVSDDYLHALQEQGISYVFAGDGEDDEQIGPALASIQELFPHVHTLLLEGGGTINGAFLKSKLIDEISLIVCPLLDGSAKVQNFMDYHGDADPRPGAGQKLELIEKETLAGGVLYLRYAVDRE